MPDLPEKVAGHTYPAAKLPFKSMAAACTAPSQLILHAKSLLAKIRCALQGATDF